MRNWISLLLGVCALLIPVRTFGHEVRPAYLEVRQVEPEVYDVLWKVPAAGRDMRLGIYVRFPEGVKEVGEPRGFFADAAYLERRRVELPGGLAGRLISIDGLAATQVEVLARVELGGGATQTARITPDAPHLRVETSPTGWQVVWTYLVLGVEHILLGIDHLLFVLALLLVVKGKRRLVGTITAFTVAHSITLAAAALGFVHMPGPPVEACIALSIVFVSAEIVHERQGRPGITAQSPWIVAFVFGLLHGFGFAGALSDVGLPPQAIPLALLFFNVGVEVGQLAFVAIMLLVVTVARPLAPRLPAWGWRILPYAIGSVAMFWVLQRVRGFV